MSTGPQRIPRHQPQRPTITTIEPRGNASQRGYDVVWKRLRLMVLRREPLCRRCGAGASQVDHILPIRKGGRRLDSLNLQALCAHCHSQKTATEDR